MHIKYDRIALTVGISLFHERNLLRAEVNDGDGLAWPSGAPTPMQQDGYSQEQALQQWKSGLQRHVRRLSTVERKRLSAEVSLVEALSRRQLLTKSPRIDLVASDTLGGKAATLLLEPLLEKLFRARVHSHIVEEFDVGNPEALKRGIGRFLDRLSSILDQGNIHDTCLAPIGGYKVMIAYAYLLGSWRGYPSAYLHEDQQNLFFIPPIPLHVRAGFTEGMSPLLRKIRRGAYLEDLHPEEKKVLQDYPHMFEVAENLVVLNAFTEFLFQSEEFGGYGDLPILVSPDARKAIDRVPQLESFIANQLTALATKMLKGSSDMSLHHERQYPNYKRGSFSLYKGASNGATIFRALYRHLNTEDVILIAKIWTNHDIYSKEIGTSLAIAPSTEQALKTWKPQSMDGA